MNFSFALLHSSLDALTYPLQYSSGFFPTRVTSNLCAVVSCPVFLLEKVYVSISLSHNLTAKVARRALLLDKAFKFCIAIMAVARGRSSGLLRAEKRRTDAALSWGTSNGCTAGQWPCSYTLGVRQHTKLNGSERWLFIHMYIQQCILCVKHMHTNFIHMYTQQFI